MNNLYWFLDKYITVGCAHPAIDRIWNFLLIREPVIKKCWGMDTSFLVTTRTSITNEGEIIVGEDYEETV